MKKIIVIDDCEDIRDMLKDLLGDHCIVLDYSNGKDALKHIQEACLVITDYNMPNMNGLEVLKAIRAQDKDIPVWLYSSNSDHYLIDFIKNGGNRVFFKTQTREMIKNAISLLKTKVFRIHAE